MTRTEVLLTLVKRFNYKSYLEIGVQSGANFRAIPCAHKVGVDPDPRSDANVRLTSDEYFQRYTLKFDLIFIDGLHEHAQVRRDIENSLHVLNPGGTIVCHDLNPASEAMQQVPRVQEEWTGDCWRAWMHFRHYAWLMNLQMFVIDTDYGCGIIQLGVASTQKVPDTTLWSYAQFAERKQELLNLISPERFLTWTIG